MGVSVSHDTNICDEADPDGYQYSATFEREPFGQGAFRYAFKGRLHGHGPRDNELCVVKVFKEKHADEFSIYRPDISLYKRANLFAQDFNKLGFERKIRFPTPLVARMDSHGGFRVLFLFKRKDTRYVARNEKVFIEKFLPGTYQKFNNNFGFEDEKSSSLLPAFTHWTYEKSKHKFILCDLQGVKTEDEYLLTDPAVNSVEQLYEECGTDCGITGIDAVLKGHTCNAVCRTLNLPSVGPPSGSKKTKISTSSYSHQLSYEQKKRNEKAARNALPYLPASHSKDL